MSLQNADCSIARHFLNLTDPRQGGKIHHKLIDMITITICAVISGCDDWTEISLYGNEKIEWLSTFLELPNGIPSHDTFSRVFSIISPDELETCFLSWVSDVFEKTDKQVIAIDGKTLRRSHDKGANQKAIHMVSAWAAENKITLAQVATDQKSNEITAIPELLKLLEVNGCIVTIDAMGCQTKIADQIVDQGADYVLAVKGNQGNLHDDLQLYFQDAVENGFNGVDYDYFETIDGDHGRVEIRRYWTVSDIDWIDGKDKWKDLNIIGMAQSERHVGDHQSIENRYFISTLPNNAELFGKSVRQHWGIVNSAHWILDIAFREDDCRKRKGNSGINFSKIRRIALNLLKNDKSRKVGVKAKRKSAGWNNSYLESLLAG